MPKAPKCETVCASVCVFKFFSETTGPTEAKFHGEPPLGRKIYSNDSGHLLFFI